MQGAAVNERNDGKRIEGVKGIAAFLGVSERSVWRWVRDPERAAPIRKVGGRHFAFEDELEAWTEKKAA